MLLIAIEKPSDNARLGLSLDETRQGRVIVSRVSRTGLFAASPLKVGMEIVMVNDVMCDGLRQVSQAMQSASRGTLTLQVIEAPEHEEEKEKELQPHGGDFNSKQKQQPQQPTKSTRNITREIDEVAPGAVEILLDPERQPQPPPPPPLPTAARALRKSSSSFNRKKNNNTLTILVPHVPKLGLRLYQQDVQHVVVKDIHPDSVFAGTELRPGMRILAMNDFGCVGCSVEEVSEMFRQPPLPDGVLTLVVQDTTTSTAKSSSSYRRQQSNESSASSQENHQHVVADPTAGAAVPKDLSQRFQRYKSARSTQQQEQDHQQNAKKASLSLSNSTSRRTSRSSSSSARTTASVIRASVHKSSASQATGVRLKESRDKQSVVVQHVNPDGLFADTTLRAGMTIVRVNGMDTTGLSVQQMAQIVRETHGKLTLEAAV